MLLKIKIEIDLPDETYNFFKARAIIKNKRINKELIDFLKKEKKILEKETFEQAIL